jgi:hypothetical protein
VINACAEQKIETKDLKVPAASQIEGSGASSGGVEGTPATVGEFVEGLVQWEEAKNSGSTGPDHVQLSRLSQLYLHDSSLRSLCPALLDSLAIPPVFANFAPADGTSDAPIGPSAFGSKLGSYDTYDYLQRIPSSVHPLYSNLRDYWPSLFIGAPGTASGLHADWGDTAAWMLLARGRKQWVIVPPVERLKLRERATQHTFDADVLRGQFGNAANARSENESYSYFEATLEPGELIFIPAGAAHQVSTY